jgi:hypothetical protein
MLEWHSAAVPRFGALARLSTLQQLTRLQLAEVGRAQLQQLHLPQLRVLEVQIFDVLPGRCLKLHHLTALQQLKVTDATPLLSGDQLPPNLKELVCVRRDPLGHNAHGDGIGCSFALTPLLALSCLEKLQLHTQGAAATAAGLQQLSRLSELGLSFSYGSLYAACNQLTASVAEAWHFLQLRSLKLHNVEVTACFLQQLAGFKGLACLSLDQVFVSHHGGKLALQLAAALEHLTGLQCLALTNTLPECCNDDDDTTGVRTNTHAAIGYVEGLPALLHAIGGLPALTDVFLHWDLPAPSLKAGSCCLYDGLKLSSAAYQQLCDMLGQALAPWLVPHCELRRDLLKICT